MQIIEVTDLGARTAVVTLTRQESPMRFMILPMVHLADAKFYSAVQKRLAGCQIVVVEGVQGPSAATRAITRSYRLLKHKKSLGMVVQEIDYSSLQAEVIYPDISGAEMDQSWKKVPLGQRLMVGLFVPVFVVWMPCFGSRRVIASHLALDDLPTPQQQADNDFIQEKFGEAENLIVERRDQLLLDVLAKVHEAHSTEAITVGIVYGAAHVAAVVRALHQRFGYIARSGEWVDLFSL